MSRTLVDTTGFAQKLTEATLLDGDALLTVLQKIHLNVRQDDEGKLFLVHRDGAYVSAAILDGVAKLFAKTSTLSILCNTKHTEDDFIRAFRFAWNDK